MGRTRMAEALADAGADALAQAQDAPAPADAPALADAPTDTGDAPAPTDDAPADAPRKRDLSAQVQTVQPLEERYALAPTLDGSDAAWHATPDGGKIAITRHTTGEGERATVRDFLTYKPGNGRVQSIPLYAIDKHPEIEV